MGHVLYFVDLSSLCCISFEDLYKDKLRCGSKWVTDNSCCLSSQPKTSKHRPLGTHIIRLFILLLLLPTPGPFFLLDVTSGWNYYSNNIATTTQQRFCWNVLLPPDSCIWHPSSHQVAALMLINTASCVFQYQPYSIFIMITYHAKSYMSIHSDNVSPSCQLAFPLPVNRHSQ